MRLKRRLLFYRPTRPTRLRVYFFFSQPFFPQMLALLWLFLSSLVVLTCSSVVCLVLFTQGFHSQNFCAIFAERTAKFFFLCASVLREKKTTIIHKSNFAQNCPLPFLRNSSFAQFCNQSFAQFRNFVKIKRLVTVCVSQNSILPVLEGFVPKSETDCPVKVSTILVLDMHIS